MWAFNLIIINFLNVFIVGNYCASFYPNIPEYYPDVNEKYKPAMIPQEPHNDAPVYQENYPGKSFSNIPIYQQGEDGRYGQGTNPDDQQIGGFRKYGQTYPHQNFSFENQSILIGTKFDPLTRQRYAVFYNPQLPSFLIYIPINTDVSLNEKPVGNGNDNNSILNQKEETDLLQSSLIGSPQHSYRSLNQSDFSKSTHEHSRSLEDPQRFIDNRDDSNPEDQIPQRSYYGKTDIYGNPRKLKRNSDQNPNRINSNLWSLPKSLNKRLMRYHNFLSNLSDPVTMTSKLKRSIPPSKSGGINNTVIKMPSKNPSKKILRKAKPLLQINTFMPHVPEEKEVKLPSSFKPRMIPKRDPNEIPFRLVVEALRDQLKNLLPDIFFNKPFYKEMDDELKKLLTKFLLNDFLPVNPKDKTFEITRVQADSELFEFADRFDICKEPTEENGETAQKKPDSIVYVRDFAYEEKRSNAAALGFSKTEKSENATFKILLNNAQRLDIFPGLVINKIKKFIPNLEESTLPTVNILRPFNYPSVYVGCIPVSKPQDLKDVPVDRRVTEEIVRISHLESENNKGDLVGKTVSRQFYNCCNFSQLKDEFTIAVTNISFYQRVEKDVTNTKVFSAFSDSPVGLIEPDEVPDEEDDEPSQHFKYIGGPIPYYQTFLEDKRTHIQGINGFTIVFFEPTPVPTA